MAYIECSKCWERHDPAQEQHVCAPAMIASKQDQERKHETQEQLIRRVFREEIQLAFPERYAAKL